MVQDRFNPNVQVGGASTLPASIGGSYSGAVSGGAPARGPLASTWSTSSSGSSSPYNSPPASPTAGRANPSAITFPAPNYSNALPRATGGATAQVGPIKVQPPFLNNIIQINVAVQGNLSTLKQNYFYNKLTYFSPTRLF